MIESTQRSAAKLVGFLYLLTNATAITFFSLKMKLIVAGDAAKTAANIIASERNFRLSIVFELITIAGVLLLVAALNTVLKPIDRQAARYATFLRLGENFVLAITTFTSFAILNLLSDAPFLRGVDPAQLRALAYAAWRVAGDGFRVGFFFLGLGSAVFAWLWWRSRYIPRFFAGLGIFASLLMALMELTILLFPPVGRAVGMIYMGPMGLFEIGLGIWLLVRPLRTTEVA
jgi:Domain of unknown function (DUF4386)